MLRNKKKDNNKGCKIISNKELNYMLDNVGRNFTLTMYINRKFALTKKQLDYVMKYSKGGDKIEKGRI